MRVKHAMQDSIHDTIQIIISEKLGLSREDICDNICFANELDVDSLDMLEIYWEIEKKFNTSIPDEDIKKLTTLHEINSYIIAKKGR
ncbi:MAG: acyl carrier protein [Bacteroidetes bacterium]|nr:acyl carrier protein [Bacteroidota bacterium]